MKKIYLGTDHAGFELKEAVRQMLEQDGYDVEDMGAYQFDAVDDYPDFIYPAAKMVSEDPDNSYGMVFGGSGNGEAMLANKLPNVRCALCWDEFTIEASREHNNANMLSLGSRTMTTERALKLIKLWLATEFAGDERHVRRIDKIKHLENN